MLQLKITTVPLKKNYHSCNFYLVVENTITNLLFSLLIQIHQMSRVKKTHNLVIVQLVFY